jgi:hypothetical protein
MLTLVSSIPSGGLESLKTLSHFRLCIYNDGRLL